MLLFDDKTKGIIKSGKQLIIQEISSNDDVTFKASFVVASDLECTGKITALFDLIVIGNVYAEEMDVKGHFICLGHCSVKGSLIVQNDIWGERIVAESIICHEQINAQEIEAVTVLADGNIIVGKTLAIEEKAQTLERVICGETAFGAGKLVATTILTAEPIDLDDGEDAIESPFEFSPKASSNVNAEIAKMSANYQKSNDYSTYLQKLMQTEDVQLNNKLKRYQQVLLSIEAAMPGNIVEFRDVSLLIWLLEIKNSEYFSDWNEINNWSARVLHHFDNMVHGKISDEKVAKPATKLEKGYVVTHDKYGRGVVLSKKIVVQNFNPQKKSLSNWPHRRNVANRTQAEHFMVTILFDLYGEKKFPIPDALNHFMVLSEANSVEPEEVRNSISCTISSYSEWLMALEIIDRYKEYIGNDVYEVIFELLLAKLGLKSKFVTERFKEKGWN